MKHNLSDLEYEKFIKDKIMAKLPQINLDEVFKTCQEHPGASGVVKQLIEQFFPYLSEMGAKNDEPITLAEFGTLLIASGLASICVHEESLGLEEQSKDKPHFELPTDPFKGRVSFN